MRTRPASRTLPVTVLALVFLLALAVPALAAEIELTEDGFSPRTVRVDAGEDVVWVNGTDEEQTVVGADGTWDSGPLQPGETFSVALRQPGTYGFATADGSAEGELRVREAAPDAAPAEAAPATSLPRTGEGTPVLLGWGLVLVGSGILVLRRARLALVP
jgi:LPXTG-motif cell wall-anchored protein